MLSELRDGLLVFPHMPLTAITREVSSSINGCELSFHERQAIDVTKAIAQPTTAGSSNANMTKGVLL